MSKISYQEFKLNQQFNALRETINFYSMKEVDSDFMNQIEKMPLNKINELSSLLIKDVNFSLDDGRKLWLTHLTQKIVQQTPFESERDYLLDRLQKSMQDEKNHSLREQATAWVCERLLTLQTADSQNLKILQPVYLPTIATDKIFDNFKKSVILATAHRKSITQIESAQSFRFLVDCIEEKKIDKAIILNNPDYQQMLLSYFQMYFKQNFKAIEEFIGLKLCEITDKQSIFSVILKEHYNPSLMTMNPHYLHDPRNKNGLYNHPYEKICSFFHTYRKHLGIKDMSQETLSNPDLMTSFLLLASHLAPIADQKTLEHNAYSGFFSYKPGINEKEIYQAGLSHVNFNKISRSALRAYQSVVKTLNVSPKIANIMFDYAIELNRAKTLIKPSNIDIVLEKITLLLQSHQTTHAAPETTIKPALNSQLKKFKI